MIHKISLKKLKSVANPFEQVCFSEMNEPIKKDDVLNCISEGIVFPLEDSSFSHKVATSIAYEFLNFEANNPININLKNTANGWIVKKGVAQLAASILRDEDFIYADIEGDDKIIKTIFGKTQTVDITPLDKKVFKWNTQELSLVNSWENIHFIIKKIHISPKENLDQILKMIPVHKWLNTDFLKLIIPAIKDYDFYNFDLKILQSDSILNIVKDDHVLFSTLWKNCYKNIYEKEENNMSSSPNVLKEKLSIVEKYLKSKIDKEVFSNKAMCLELIDYSYFINNLYRHFSFENKMDKDIVNKIFEKERINSDYHSHYIEKDLPPDFFKEKENILLYLRRGEFPSEEFIESNPYVYNSWINNKEQIINIINDKKTKGASYFFKYLSSEFKKDKDILIPFIERFPDIYLQLKEKLKNDPEIVQKFIQADGDPLCLRNSIIFNFTDLEIIKKIISKNPKLLLEKDCPPFWREDIDILLSVPAKIYTAYSCFPKKMINLALSTEESCLFMLEQTPEIYEKISVNLKLSHAVSSCYLRRIDDESTPYKINNIPKKLWGTKSFCLIAMQANHKAAIKVPAPFFYEKDFVISFVKAIDNSLIEKEALDYAPREINQILDSFSINSNYEDFLNKYILNSQLSTELIDKNTNNINNKNKKI